MSEKWEFPRDMGTIIFHWSTKLFNSREHCNFFLLDSTDPKTATNAVAGSSDVNDVNGSSSGAPPISILPCLAEEPDDQDQDEEEADETSFLTRKQTKAWVAPKVLPTA